MFSYKPLSFSYGNYTYRLVFASNRVGVGVTYGQSKIGVVGGVINTTEWESDESERFHFLPTPLTTPSFTI